MAKFFRKFKKPYFGAVLDHFWPNLVKNEFSWKKDLRQFLNTPIIYQREKNHKKPMTHFWGLIIYFCFILCWLSKNHTHAKKVGQTSELLFGIYWKTTIYLKNCCWKSWILIFTMLYLKKKKEEEKKSTWKFNHFTPAYQKFWWLIFLRYRVRQTEIGNYVGHFLPFYHPPPPKNPKNQNFEKTKKIAGEIIILRMCTKNHNHMRYVSWDTAWDRIFCHFWNTQKAQYYVNWNTLGAYNFFNSIRENKEKMAIF